MEITTEQGMLTLDPPTLAGEEIRIGEVTPIDRTEGDYTHALTYRIASDLRGVEHTTRLPRISAMLVAGVRADTADPKVQEVWAGLLAAYVGPDAVPRLVARACDEMVAVLHQRGMIDAVHRAIMRRSEGGA